MSVTPNFEATLSVQSSRKIIDAVVDSIGDNPKYFKQVLDMSFTKPYPLNMRSAWAIMHSSAKQPQLIEPHINELTEKVSSCNNHSVRRSLLKVFAENVDLGRITDLGILINICFNYLESVKEPVANKVYSMEIIYKACWLHPELAEELKCILEHNIDMGTSGYKHRARKILAKL